VLAIAAMALTACGSDFTGVKLTMVTGNASGVYYKLGGALADAWTAQLGVAHPQVVATAGSVDNLERLRTGQADVGFSAADAAFDATLANRPRKLRALARMHDDYLQVVVRADLPAHELAGLKGLRVSIGEPGSGVEFIAKRLLGSAKISSDTDLVTRQLGLGDSLTAMRDGTLDAFFWSGGVPTPGVTNLAESIPLRMLDLSAVLPVLRKQYPVYGSATLPASAYGLPGGPITTLVVRNFLLATDAMSDDVAEALVRGIFLAQPQLQKANSAARSIEIRSAIETTPVDLHPGAARYYRSVKV
jgi:TRAP transporter TAXI family solute receptor